MTSDYPLIPFRVDDRPSIHNVIDRYPLATLISGRAEPENITLVPLLRHDLDPDSTHLLGHLDRNNPHCAELRTGEPVSFVFRGHDAYASPDLYPDAQLPGWLYLMVKGRGVVRRLEDADTRQLLVDATREFGGADQSFVLNPSDERIDRFIGGIVAFEITVTEISGISKLAQDKSPAHSNLAREHLMTNRC